MAKEIEILKKKIEKRIEYLENSGYNFGENLFELERIKDKYIPESIREAEDAEKETNK